MTNSKLATPGAIVLLIGLLVFYWGFSNTGRKHGLFGFPKR